MNAADGIDIGASPRGSYLDSAGNIVSFARTLGYEEYDGLGWWGAIVQRADDDETIRQSLGF